MPRIKMLKSKKKFNYASVRDVVTQCATMLHKAIAKQNPDVDIDDLEDDLRVLVRQHGGGKVADVAPTDDVPATTASVGIQYSLSADLLVMAREQFVAKNYRECYRLCRAAFETEDAAILTASLSEMNQSSDVGVTADMEDEDDEGDHEFRGGSPDPDLTDDTDEDDADDSDEDDSDPDATPGVISDEDQDDGTSEDDDDDDQNMAADDVANETTDDDGDNDDDDDDTETVGDEDGEDGADDAGEDHDDPEASDEVMASVLADMDEDEDEDEPEESDPEDDDATDDNDDDSVPMGGGTARKKAKEDAYDGTATAKLRALANKMSLSGTKEDREKAARIVRKARK
jgi:hypothetical protein